jgi:thioredoxin 1
MRKLNCIKEVMIVSMLVIALSCNSQQKPATEGKPQDNKVAKYNVTFVELGSVRCIPCQQMQPVMKSIEQKYGTQVKVVFHDVWTEAGAPYAKQYGIEAIPTQVFLDEAGKEYFRHVGFFPEEELVKILQMKGVKLN